MKKAAIAAAALGCVIVIVVVVGYFRDAASGAPARALALRAVMQDEDAPRPPELFVALEVNDAIGATVAAGTPVWFIVRASNPVAANEAAAARQLAARLDRLAADDPGRQRIAEAYERRRAPAKIAAGDAARPWTAAVQILLRDDAGGERPLPFAAPLLGTPPGAAGLDGRNSVQAVFGTASPALPAGRYPLVACVGATGSWKGRACSARAVLTVVEPPARPTAEQQQALNRQAARFAFLAGDPAGMENFGRKLLAADSRSVEGHLYLGEAEYRRGRWAEALREFTTARSESLGRNPKALDRPRFLGARINELLQKLYEAP